MTTEQEMQRILEDLRPSKRYIIRVRAINEFGQPSNWSDALEYITPGDSSIPGPPTDLTIDFTSPDMIARWTAPDFNSDGTIISDFSHFRVTIQAAGVAGTAVYDTAAPRFTLPFHLNEEAFGTPQSQLVVSVRAIDNTDQSSEALVGNAVNPPPPTPVAGPSVIPGFTIANISMDKNGIADFERFELYHSTDGTSFTPLDVPAGDTYYTHAISQGSTHHYKYKIVDVFNQSSPNFSPTTTITAFVERIMEDVDPPTVPTNFAITNLGEDFVEFEWDESADDNGVSYYEVRYKKQSSDVFSVVVVGASETSVRVENLAPGTFYHAKLRAVDMFGNASEYTSLLPYATSADTVPPAVPTNLRTVSGIGSISVAWDPNTEADFRNYKLYGAVNDPTFPIVETNLIYTGNGTAYVLNGIDSEDTWYFAVRAVDSSDNQSAASDRVSGSSIEAYVPDTTPPVAPTDLAVTSSVTATQQVSEASLFIDWTANTEDDLAGYDLGIKTNADTRWTSYSVPKGQNSFRVDRLLPGTTYNIRVAAYDTNINRSTYTTVNHTTGTDTTAPPAVTGLTTVPFLKSTVLSWNGVVAGDLAHYNIHVGVSPTFIPNADNRYAQTSSTSITVNKHYNGSEWVDMVAGATYYFKVSAEDRSGNVSAYTNSSGIPDYVQASSGNLLINSGFETENLDNVIPIYGATVSRSTDEKLGGTYSLRVDTDADTDPEGVAIVATPGFLLSAGRKAIGSAYVKGTAGEKLSISYRHRPIGGTNFVVQSAFAESHTLTGEWQRIVAKPYLNATDDVELQLDIRQDLTGVTTPVATTFYLDNAQLEEGEIPTAWIAYYEGPGKPPAPTDLVISEVGDILRLNFNTPTEGVVTGYEIWAAYGATSDYLIIGELDPGDIEGDAAQFDDVNVLRKGTYYYRVYAINQGLKSDPLTGSHAVTRNVAEDGIDFEVEPMASSFIITWDVPEDRLFESVSITYEARTTNTGFNFANSVEVYRGVSDSYIHEIEPNELDYYHQFWLTVNTRS